MISTDDSLSEKLPEIRRKQIIVAGAGAAGLTAAIFAAEAGAEVTLLERTDKAGRKILMSGGTRCNVLPVRVEPGDYFTGSSPNLMKRIFRSWSLDACHRWFTDDLGLELACETESNKWFPLSNSAKDVRDALLNKALECGVRIIYNFPVQRIKRSGERWNVYSGPAGGSRRQQKGLQSGTSGRSGAGAGAGAGSGAGAGAGSGAGAGEGEGADAISSADINTYADASPDSTASAGSGLDSNPPSLSADSLIIATGGFSIPSTGTDGMGHRVLAKAGHKTAPVYAALTPLTGSDPAHLELAGVSLDVQLSVYIYGRKVIESDRSGFLFTHRGYSGPSVLDVSHFQVQAMEQGLSMPLPEYRVNWDGTAREKWEKRLLEGKGRVESVLKAFLPNRLAGVLCREAGVTGKNCAELGRNDRKKLLHMLTEYPLKISGHEGYKKAEVTGGGVPLEEINTATLESSIHPGLYLCGEILDVFGRIGGFNFYWAWVTGRLAGMSAVRGMHDHGIG